MLLVRGRANGYAALLFPRWNEAEESHKAQGGRNIPMPTFESMTRSEAELQSASGTRAALMREYVGYIERVPVGEAGRLSAGPEESLAAIRRRLGAAARYLGRDITIKRSEDALYFWHGSIRRRRHSDSTQ